MTEVEKYFETKVNPNTIRKKAERIEHGTNIPPAGNPAVAGVGGGCTGCKTTTEAVKEVEEVEEKVSKGTSVREAAKKVAEKTGKPVKMKTL